jgi:hypothetical protein
MVEYILLACMAAVVIVMLALRTHTAICFLALCAGSVLLLSSGENMSLIASSLTSGVDASANFVRIILLLAPVVICIIMLRGYLKKSFTIFAFVPAVATVFLMTLLVIPELSTSAQTTLRATETFQLLTQYQEVIIALGLATSLFLILISMKKPESAHKKGKH